MDTLRIFRRAEFGAAFVILLVGSSCGGPSMNPQADKARSALEASLTAWRDGKKPGQIEGTDPPVQAVDNEWTNGRKLAAFEILSEEATESDKRFVVKLTYATPTAETQSTYIVVGSSPIAVFREEDYVRTMNMDNNPTPAKTKKKR